MALQHGEDDIPYQRPCSSSCYLIKLSLEHRSEGRLYKSSQMGVKRNDEWRISSLNFMYGGPHQKSSTFRES